MTRRGQGTVEFALMIPLLFGLTFLVVEFAYYFGAIHWDNYATFVAARGVQVGQSSFSTTERALLSGKIHKYKHDGRSYEVELETQDDRASVTQPWIVDTPGIEELFGGEDIGFKTTVVLGSEEAQYERLVNAMYADNNVGGF